MKLSRANLEVGRIASTDKADAELAQLHIEDDGSTVASNGRSMLVVQPMSEENMGAAMPVMEDECGIPKGGVGIRLDVVDDTLGNLPKGNLALELGFAVVTNCDEQTRSIELTTTDLNKRRKVEGRISRGRFPEYKHVLRQAKRGVKYQVCVDRKELVALLQAMDKACVDPDNKLFLEFGGENEGLLLRGFNHQTRQSAVGYTMPMDTGGDRLVESAWERRLFGQSAKKRIKR